MKNLIYSYRITHFGGTAPCDDDGLLTLAICKRDMRRVIGRQFCSSLREDVANRPTFWFVGLTGTHLAPKLNQLRGDVHYEPGKVLYVAKVTGVKTFKKYFGNACTSRRDKIYVPSHKKSPYCSGGEFFIHKEGEPIHATSDLQDRDWDIGRQGEKYVLESRAYAYLSPDSHINSLAGGRFAKGVGHTHFEVESDTDIVKALEAAVEAADHGGAYRPRIGALEDCEGCGKDKAI